MKRSLKNIIMILLLVILLGCISYTVYVAKESTLNNNNNITSNIPEMPDNMGTPPDMDESNNSDDNSSNRGRMGNPPEKPSNDMDNNNTDNSEIPNPPDINEENNNTSREKANTEINDNTNNDNSMTPPDMNNDNMTPPNMEEMTITNNTTSEINAKYITYFAIESFLTSMILMYLVLSNFNKKSFNETFISIEKIIIYVLGIIIVTSIITGLSYYITNLLLT